MTDEVRDLVERVERLERLVGEIAGAIGLEHVEPSSLADQVKASRDRARARRERKTA